MMNPSRILDALRARRDLWKFEARMALALHEVPSSTQASSAEIDALVARQTAKWPTGRALQGAPARAARAAVAENSNSCFILSIDGVKVRLQPKRTTGDRSEHTNACLKRAKLYRAFIETTLRRARTPLQMELLLDVNDLALQAEHFPVFCFQSPRGSANPLLPDVDFFHCKWYRGQRDTLSYEEKTCSAVFVGASTGDFLDEEAILVSRTERLRAATYFKGHPTVLFKIAKAANCLTDEARALLERQPYFSEYISWPTQLRHRFLLSMDGNGATCSRVVKGLMSNGVLVKYSSPHDLYYFSAMSAGKEYLAVESDADVERILAEEAAYPGRYQVVARAGQAFAERYLRIGSVMDYTARLLQVFSNRT
ncbi:hypothetical protein IP84_02765 [beta proteobacterium AAP99]|nr:hypothetical protein IP84_02765 [beta proteobacterium AAP99]